MHELEPFFNPSSIAVIGASRTPGKIGYTILENLKKTFSGNIYPINLEATEILGLKAYPTVLEIKEPIDLAVIAVKAEVVKFVLNDCIKKKIKAAVIISSGFSEIGKKERELELKDLSKKIRILGPNCLGLFIPKVMDMLFLERKRLKRPLEGSISFLTQSGAVGSAIMDLISWEGAGISKFISYGNAVDVNEVELMEYLGRDVGTRAIAMYLESTQDGHAFMAAANKIVKSKPIVCLKAGKTAKGIEAVASHTGALAGSAQIYSAAFKQAGIIEAKTTEELFDFAKVLASQPLPKTGKIAVITDGGGFGILATDAALEFGLELAELDKSTVKALKDFLPEYAIVSNPVDLTGDSNSERYEKALEAVMNDKGVSAVICITLMQVPTIDETITDVLRDAKIYGKPIVVCSTGGEFTIKHAQKLERFGIPVYPTPERAAKALSSLWEYSKIRKMYAPEPAPERKVRPAKRKKAKKRKK